MKVSILLFGAAVLASSILRAGEVCATANTEHVACIFSNFGPGQSYKLDTGLTPGYSNGGAVGVAFTPSLTFELLNIEVAAFRANSGVPDAVHFAIYDDSGQSGFPGSLIEGFNLTGFGVANTDPQPGDPAAGSVTTSAAYRVSAASAQHPFLTGGLRYWIVMDGIGDSGNVTWNANSTNQLDAATIAAPASPGDPALWTSLTGYAQGSFALDGDPSTPEPSTFLLAAPFALAFGLCRRKN